MRAFLAILVCAALVAGGAALAVASGGGRTHGSPAHHQYKPKPPCKHKHGYSKSNSKSRRGTHRSSRGGGYHGRGHCPKPKPHRR